MDVIFEALASTFKFVFRFLVETIVEVLIKGAGYLVVRPFTKKVNSDSFLVVLTGITFWVLLFVSSIYGFRYWEASNCIALEGAFNHQTKQCEHY
ncbi:hypothetical protein SOPP22_12535 [Shewanella sp. OPT22]|nr:hypothetical protein SOPP22_12535 [Shewanella sp. OPT22]